MYKLLVLYPYPDDPQAFLDYYRQHHLPLVKQLPGLLASRFGQPQAFGAKPAPYFLIFEAEFADEQTLAAALSSPQGKAVGADVANYSPKGATMLRLLVES